ncbi:hypothetical protein SBOR_2513 [Sclerotinia borealis F-4128]|uniref:Uncharacterized protein n=1 Tax=Sclerotinia borealis (strain F-4128) TaxID=1432307 RepID=W9CM17_SCLBF|nr:hypothetical protein SBOR_2513 [Sclerotinia borealis F-4128]
MSRALDKDAAASIKAGEAQKFYNDIVQILSLNTSSDSLPHKLLDIELLGKGQLPDGVNSLILQNSVGIRKDQLVQAFVVARQVFFKIKDLGPDYSQEIRDATAVILLTDPEHLTACNARKRLLQHILNTSATTRVLETAVKRELYFIDSLLTSHLNRHTKSPTLWSHRRWLFEIRQSMHLPHDVLGDLTSIVMVAAERHPRNYYAFSHMRWLVESVEGGLSASTYLVMIDNVKKWCLRHPGDTSGWSFLLFCLSSDTILKALDPVVRTSLICEEVLGMAISLRWKEESLWVFLRTLVASGNVTEKWRFTFLQTLEDLKNSLDDPRGRRITQAALEWYLEYGEKTQSVG